MASISERIWGADGFRKCVHVVRWKSTDGRHRQITFHALEDATAFREKINRLERKYTAAQKARRSMEAFDACGF